MSEQLNTTDESVTSALAADSQTTENSATEIETSDTETQTTETSAPAIPAKKELTFHDLPLSPPILKALDRAQFTVPTPIQAQAIPIVTAGKDMIGIAQTGTGKTLAFGLPILQNFVENRNAGRALIILPTRELALQVEEALQGMARQVQIALGSSHWRRADSPAVGATARQPRFDSSHAGPPDRPSQKWWRRFAQR